MITTNDPTIDTGTAVPPTAEPLSAATGDAADGDAFTLAQAPPAFALQPLKRIVEAALLAASHPLTLPQLYALFPDDQPALPGSLEQALAALREDCAERGIELVEVASGFRFQVRTDVYPWITRLWTERQTRYTRATLETLALIAYRQPITRGEIEQIRGVAVNANIIRMLEEREWIRVIGHRDVPGKPALFGTTKAFLDYFNLASLDQLPPLAELRDLADADLQLSLDAGMPPAVASVAVPAPDAVAAGDAMLGEALPQPSGRGTVADDVSSAAGHDAPAVDAAADDAPVDDAHAAGDDDVRAPERTPLPQRTAANAAAPAVLHDAGPDGNPDASADRSIHDDHPKADGDPARPEHDA